MAIPRPIPFVIGIVNAYIRSPDTRVVEVGCGAAQYRDVVLGEYVGVDRVPAPHGVPGRVDIVAPAEDMPLEDGSADLMFTVGALYQFDDPNAALRECRRVLRPGGRVVIIDYNRRTQILLERLEGGKRPKWTALGLKRRMVEGGFRNVELLLPRDRQPHGVERLVRLVIEELRGQWAIATGIRP